MDSEYTFTSSIIHDIIAAHQRGVELSAKDALTLAGAEGDDLRGIMAYANDLCVASHGKRVSFVVNRNINFTNVCTLQCHFCAFSVPPCDPRSYLLSFDEIARKVIEAKANHCTEVCIQGGIHPEIDLDYYIGILRTVKEIAPEIHVHAFSPQEIYNMLQRSSLPLNSLLKMLQEAGLGSIPGTAAEILVDGIRRKLCPRKIQTAQWRSIIVAAHRLGIPTTSTIMFGSIENWDDRCAHLNEIRNIQKETKGFTEFVPLVFIPPSNAFWKGQGVVTTSKSEILKIYAIARIFFHDTIPNIQTSWVKLGPPLARETLDCGVNDFGGTLMEENISKSAGAKHGEFLSPDQIKELIRAAG
ncbi:MAG: 5-amino-6-(D-ribitylamino)uracil--L-tyrosine 4-hydroxyphenyl transferase CofH, partial [Candidatus Sigynarchaeota archaeon]